MKKLQRLALLSLFLLPACGFSPIYGNHGGQSEPVAKALSNVRIENIGERNGQILRNKLIDRMYAAGRPQNPTASLNVNLAISESALGVQKDSTSTRSQMTVKASFTLKDMTGRTLHTGQARSIVGYSKLDAQYGTLASQRDAQERAINEIGEQIVNNIALYYAEKAPQQSASAK